MIMIILYIDIVCNLFTIQPLVAVLEIFYKNHFIYLSIYRSRLDFIIQKPSLWKLYEGA